MSCITPWFVLSYPRSRTAWLSAYLTGAGIYTFHEAWKMVRSPEELVALMDAKGPGPVVNSDCSNVFFLPEITRLFPNARYLRILNDEHAVLDSLRTSYGDHDYRDMMGCYARAFAHAPADCTLDCRNWTEASVREAWRIMSNGTTFDADWYAQMSGVLVQLMPEQIQTDIQRVVDGELSHIGDALTRWRASWV